ncbi:glycosyltransferase [Microbacterium sp. STN6]|uniref:glycosyltransferase n=1 Tax=Microbacterium sp. STN6 TaxID=2995588 RepID=UPI002260DE15|nr:glycosyltransferase [Microbacterium sp. STN6]MCX7521048.1 glycosyltransferase [Microbacterium sp. STN6]
MSVRTALVVCFSTLDRDPRVVREIDWLQSDGWAVDSLGLGDKPRPTVRKHYPLLDPPTATRPTLARAAIHMFLPYRARFRLLMGSRIPQDLGADGTRYDLILINDMDLLPWIVLASPSLLSARGHVHLDVHEYHAWAPPSRWGRIAKILFAGYHEWTKSFVASPVFATRTTVAGGIAALYAREYGVPRAAVVRNAPDFVNALPSPVNPDHIGLVYHGNADLKRGFDLLIQAVELLDSRFYLTLMLTGAEDGKAAVRALAGGNPRIHFVDPVPLLQVAQRINEFDLEVMFFPPVTENLRNALPNKLFEAVQGRLGLVIGKSPEMVRIIEQYGNGVVTPEWTAASLASTINGLSAERVVELKHCSDTAARELSASAERERFLAAVEFAGDQDR